MVVRESRLVAIPEVEDRTLLRLFLYFLCPHRARLGFESLPQSFGVPFVSFRTARTGIKSTLEYGEFTTSTLPCLSSIRRL